MPKLKGTLNVGTLLILMVTIGCSKPVESSEVAVAAPPNETKRASQRPEERKPEEAPSSFESVEAAESFLKEQGVTLTNKKEDTKQIVATQSYGYEVGEVHVQISDFSSTEAAQKWQEAANKLASTFGTGEVLIKGRVTVSVAKGNDESREKILAVLR